MFFDKNSNQTDRNIEGLTKLSFCLSKSHKFSHICFCALNKIYVKKSEQKNYIMKKEFTNLIGPKVVQIGLKWDKSGTFLDQIS